MLMLIPRCFGAFASTISNLSDLPFTRPFGGKRAPIFT